MQLVAIRTSPTFICLAIGEYSPHAPWAASVSVLPRAGREALPLVASTCLVCNVAWECRVFSVGLVLIALLPRCRALDSVTLLSLLPSWFSPPFPPFHHIKGNYKYYSLLFMMVLWVPISATLCRRAVLMLWHVSLLLGLRIFPPFFFLLGGLRCLFVYESCVENVSASSI